MELFRPAPRGEWHRNALVGWHRVQYGEYAEAYRLAASHLIDAGLADRGELDLLIYPIVYNYRHAIESALKDSITWLEVAIASRANAGELPSDSVRDVREVRRRLMGHELTPLLADLESRMVEIPNLGTLEQNARAVVEAFDKFDADGQRFRYPTLSKDRGPSWQPDEGSQVAIDIVALREGVEPVLSSLVNGLVGWLEHDVQVRQDAAQRLTESQRRARAEAWTSPDSDWDEFVDDGMYVNGLEPEPLDDR